jgi:hypothetical protein
MRKTTDRVSSNLRDEYTGQVYYVVEPPKRTASWFLRKWPTAAAWIAAHPGDLAGRVLTTVFPGAKPK